MERQQGTPRSFPFHFSPWHCALPEIPKWRPDLSGFTREHLKMMRTCYNGRASCSLRALFLVLLVEVVSLGSGFGFSAKSKLFIKPLRGFIKKQFS